MALASTSALPPLGHATQAAIASPPVAMRPVFPAGRRVPAAAAVAAVDTAAIMAALFVAFVHRSGEPWSASLLGFLTARVHVYDLALVVVAVAATLLAFNRAGLYEAARLRRAPQEIGRVGGATALVAGVSAILVGSTHPQLVTTDAVLRFWYVGAAGVAAARLVRRQCVGAAIEYRRVVIVGSGPQALRICRELSIDPLTRYQVLGFVDTHQGAPSLFIRRRTLGSLESLESLLAREHVDEVHIGLPVKSHYPQIQETIRICERIGVKVKYGADIFGTALARARVDRVVSSGPRVELQVVADGWRVGVKRTVDIVGSLTALLLLSPLMLAVAAAIKLTSPGPVIYAQERYGLNRRRFRMFKFRTMVPNAERLQAALEAQNEAEGPVFKMANDPRVTPLGRVLRRTSIDELPQLVNVLRGEMSLVGPRPLPLRDVALFTRAADMRRFSVRPGVTGLWQVSGRSGLDFDQWITLDLHYIDHWSLVLDGRILARTIPAVIRGTGAA